MLAYHIQDNKRSQLAAIKTQNMAKYLHFFFAIAVVTLVSCNNNSTTTDKSTTVIIQNKPAAALEKPSEVTDSSANSAPTDNYAKAADETCQCITPLLEKVKQMVALQSAGKTKEIAALTEEIRKIEPQIKVCSENIRKKYGDMKTDEDKKRIFYALKDRCPDAITIGGGLK